MADVVKTYEIEIDTEIAKGKVNALKKDSVDLKKRMDELQASGKSNTDEFKQLAEAFQINAENIDKLTTKIENNNATLNRNKGLISQIKDENSGLKQSMNIVGASIGGVGEKVQNLGLAIKGLFTGNPLGLIVVGITGVIAVFKKLFTTVQPLVELVDKVKQSFENAYTAVINFFGVETTAQHDARMKQLEDEKTATDNLKKSIEDLKTANDNLEKSVETPEERKKRLQDEAQAYKNNIVSLNQQLDAYKKIKNQTDNVKNNIAGTEQLIRQAELNLKKTNQELDKLNAKPNTTTSTTKKTSTETPKKTPEEIEREKALNAQLALEEAYNKAYAEFVFERGLISMSEEQQEIARTEREYTAKIDALDKELLGETKYNELSLKLAEQKGAEEIRIRDKYRKKEEAKQKAAQKFALNSTKDSLLETTALMGENNETMFNVNKGLRIADTTIGTIQGASGAFAQASSAYPPPYGQIIGGVTAAAVTAAGLANIAKIKSEKYDKGGNGGGNKPIVGSTPNLPQQSQTTTSELTSLQTALGEAVTVGGRTSTNTQRDEVRQVVVVDDVTYKQTTNNLIQKTSVL